MLKVHVILIAATLILIPVLVAAEPVKITGLLTLQQAVARVQAAGFEVRTSRGDAAMAAADAASARASLQPQIAVSAVALNANLPQLGMPIARQAYGSASLTIPLLAASTSASAHAAAANASAAATGVETTTNDAVLATVQAYRRVQLADAVVAVRQTAVQDQQDHLRLSQLRVSAGKAPRYVVIRDRAAVAGSQQGEEDARSERDQAQNDLAALLDYSMDSEISVEPLTMLGFEETQDALLIQALAASPALHAAEERVTAAQAALSAAHATYVPTASLSAQSYNGASSPELGHGGGQIQVTATLPIADGGNRAAGVARARGILERAVALRDQARLGVQRDVADAYRELLAAQRNLATAQAAQNDADEQLRIARLRDASGKGIELDILDALSVAATARESVLRAEGRYDNAIAALRHATGSQVT